MNIGNLVIEHNYKSIEQGVRDNILSMVAMGRLKKPESLFEMVYRHQMGRATGHTKIALDLVCRPLSLYRGTVKAKWFFAGGKHMENWRAHNEISKVDFEENAVIMSNRDSLRGVVCDNETEVLVIDLMNGCHTVSPWIRFQESYHDLRIHFPNLKTVVVLQ